MIHKFNNPIRNHEFLKYFKNTSWLMGEKILRILLSLFIGVWVARYLGPESYGYLSYAISLVALAKIITHLGLEGLVVREIINQPKHEKEIMGTIFYMKLFVALIGFVILCIFAYLSEKTNITNFLILIILSLTIFVSPFEVFNLWFSAKVKGKYHSLSSSIAILTSSALKIIFILSGMTLLWFSIPFMFETIIIAILYFYFYLKHVNDFTIYRYKFSWNKAKQFLRQSWMIMLGGIFAVIYMKVDQIMLKWLVGDIEVGIYAVAATLSEAWYFIPMIIATSLFPKIMEHKKNNEQHYKKNLQRLYDLLATMALILAIIVTLVSNDVVLFLYGQEYMESGAILAIHIWAGIFVFMRALFSKWILIENVLVFSLITQGFGAVSNVFLNFVLIPKYGAYGAAIATLLSYAMASYFSLLFYSKTRNTFWMMSKAMLAPFRYILAFKGMKHV